MRAMEASMSEEAIRFHLCNTCRDLVLQSSLLKQYKPDDSKETTIAYMAHMLGYAPAFFMTWGDHLAKQE